MQVFVLRMMVSIGVFLALLALLWKLKLKKTATVVAAGGLVVVFVASWFVFGQLTFFERQ